MVKIAVHNDDVDGLACAALFIKKYPDAEIHFLSVEEARESNEYYDFIADLPKSNNAKVNIDHHESNLRRLKEEKRLSQKDLIDPNAPSAASLVAKYLGLEDEISQEIVEIANKADRGVLEGDVYKLDKLIKRYLRDQKILLQLAKILSKHGRGFSSTPFFRSLWHNLKKEIEKANSLIKSAISELEASKAKYAIILQNSNIPYFMAKDIAYEFLNSNGKAVAVFYKDPNTGLNRVSIRISKDCDIDASQLAERLGGGGHNKAAGAVFRNLEWGLGIILEEFGRLGPVVVLRMGDNDYG